MQLLKLKRKWRKRQVCDIWWGERRIFFDGYEDNIEVDGKLILFLCFRKISRKLCPYLHISRLRHGRGAMNFYTHILCWKGFNFQVYITQMWQSKKNFFFHHYSHMIYTLWHISLQEFGMKKSFLLHDDMVIRFRFLKIENW